MANPWMEKDGVFKKHMQSLVRSMHSPTIRGACYAQDLITFDEDADLSEMKNTDCNRKLLQMLAGRGNLRTFIKFREILRKNTADGQDEFIQDFDTVGNGGTPSAGGEVATAAAAATAESASRVQDQPAPSDPVYNWSASFAETFKTEDLVEQLKPYLNPNQRRDLAKEIVEKYTPTYQNNVVNAMHDFADDRNDLRGKNEVTNIHISLAFASHHSGLQDIPITRQEVYDLLKKVCPVSTTKFKEVFSKAKP